MSFRSIRYEDVDWLHLACGRTQCLANVQTVINIQLTRQEICWFVERQIIEEVAGS